MQNNLTIILFKNYKNTTLEIYEIEMKYPSSEFTNVHEFSGKKIQYFGRVKNCIPFTM